MNERKTPLFLPIIWVIAAVLNAKNLYMYISAGAETNIILLNGIITIAEVALAIYFFIKYFKTR